MKKNNRKKNKKSDDLKARPNLVVKFDDVTKVYRLYKNDRDRFLGLFWPKIEYVDKLAVNSVSFEITRGESVAILGRNGAGKSTILKMITGVVFPTTGSINVNGRVSALLELTAGFDTEFTGRENIYLKGQIMGLAQEEIRELENIIVEFAELEEYIDQPVRTYSSGMKARLGFAINANIKPEILVVDEALSVGDTQFREKCRNLIDEIMAKEHVTVIFVTHSSSSATEFCERGIILEEGYIKFDGDVNEAVEYYEKRLG